MFRAIFVISGLTLTGCGGGGDPIQTPENVPPVELSSSPDTIDPQEVLTPEMTANLLQVLAMQSASVDVVNIVPTDLTSNWRDADQLTYVMLGANGEILGQAMPALPDRASFSATGTAQLAVTTQSDAYVLQHGDVTASLDLD